MRVVLLDTNIIIGAASIQASPQMSPQCQVNCIQRIQQWRGGFFALVIDSADHILDEYINRLRRLRNQKNFQGSPGDTLLRDLLQLKSMHGQFPNYPVILVTLTGAKNDDGNFAEYPQDEELAHFDRSDRKWIAAARCYQIHHPDGEPPEIQNAADSDWDEAICTFLLKKHRIVVSNICG